VPLAHNSAQTERLIAYAWQVHTGSIIPAGIDPDTWVDVVWEDAPAFDTMRAGDIDCSGGAGLIALWRRHNPQIQGST